MHLSQSMALNKFRVHVQNVGLKQTRQREIIARKFFGCCGHVTADQLLLLVRGEDQKISLATVYRTLKLLQECSLASVNNFGLGQARFEATTKADSHHDHLICKDCGNIVEFFDPEIELLQQEVASKHGFAITNHKMELYGFCPECQKKGGDYAKPTPLCDA